MNPVKISVRSLHSSIRNFLSSFVHDAYHKIQSTVVSNVNDIRSVTYNEQETRKWLSSFAGGQVTLDLDNKSKIATITLDNPDCKNALSGKMMVDFSEAVKNLYSWKGGRAVILKGSNGNFCSGGDLNFMSQISEPNLGARMCIFMQQAASRLAYCPLISVAVIDGYALGGGAELSVACDFRLMHKDAKFAFVQSRLGITPVWGGATHLTRRIGPRHSLALLASGKTVSAQEAAQIGLSDGILDQESPKEGIEHWLAPFLEANPEAALASKRVALNSYECGYAESLNREKDTLAKLWGSEVHKKAMQETLKKL